VNAPFESTFRTLGRSGLVVSPLALGTMTFGNAGIGSADDVSEAVFNAYVEAGGNFIDTADVYADGRSEELLGAFVAKRRQRDALVLATKFSFHGEESTNANAGGNGRKNMHRALDGSLRRLGTDYVDLYWMHVWDRVTPVEEVLQSLGDLVRAGKIRYFGFSNVPAWYVARAATLAGAHAIPGPIALQFEYSLVERSLEWELAPAALELGLGITPWSPLGSGFLAGKYARTEDGGATSGGGRLDRPRDPTYSKFTERNWTTLAALRAVAGEIGRPPAQVALAWVCARPAVTAPILGARTLEQLRDNLASREIVLTPAQIAELDRASELGSVYPYRIFSDEVNRSIFGGGSVAGWN
jgi:aryl-alcohol dehydrogenase-like predicted oxidoreductase